MTTTYDYSDLTVNGVTPTSIKVVHNNITTDIYRLIVNGVDIIHKKNIYSGSVTIPIKAITNIELKQFSGCSTDWQVSGTVKFELGNIVCSGDIVSASVSNVVVSPAGKIEITNAHKTMCSIPNQTNLLQTFNCFYEEQGNYSGNGVYFNFNVNFRLLVTFSNGDTFLYPTLSATLNNTTPIATSTTNVTKSSSKTIQEY